MIYRRRGTPGTIPAATATNGESQEDPAETKKATGESDTNGTAEEKNGSEQADGVEGSNEVQGEEEDRSATQCIWIARVRPEDCEGIVKFTVLQGKVVKPERQLRGGFDRERGLASW